MTKYVSCACNRTPGAIDWGKNGKLCIASCNVVYIATPQDPINIEQTLIGHTDRVNSVKWIRTKEGAETELVSVSVDKTAIVYSKPDHEDNYQKLCSLIGHTASVTSVCSFYSANQETFLATASADSSVRIWTRAKDADNFSCIQQLTFGTGFALDIAFTLAPKSDVLLLICACDDHRVHIFVQTDEQQFVSVATLTGHEDWVRALAVTTDSVGDVLLASSSQDTYIRIWRFKTCYEDGDKEEKDQEITLKENIYSYCRQGVIRKFTVTLETVLQGHDGWVYSVQWKPNQDADSSLCLLSASMDKSLVIWTPDKSSGVWLEQAHLGDVGGNSLGYYGARFSPDGSSVLCHGFHGGMRRWRQSTEGSWVPAPTCGGHYAPVHDICWQPGDGHFLLSVGQDQTTRCHGYWNTGNPATSSWHEIARPQVHGYDMQCIAMIDRFTFASGADEKVVRVFRSPKNFVQQLQILSKLKSREDASQEALPEGASVPALGLSNKAVYQADMVQPRDHIDEQYPEHAYQAVLGQEPPGEHDLMQNTLWPEVQKLYGHGYEIFALAAHPCGTVVASACKATQPSEAAIMLWSCETWQKLSSLESHSLTVTSLAFSHSGDRLLSVSRDRTWAVFQHQPGSGDNLCYERVAYSDKKTSVHTRIIWSCAWSHDDKYFITVSRDKKAVLWGISDTSTPTCCLGSYAPVSHPLDLPDSVTAVDMAPKLLSNNSYLIGLGLEDGRILLYKWSLGKGWTQSLIFSQNDAHHKTVKRLRFRPTPGSMCDPSNEKLLYLASAGADHAIRIYELNLDQV